MYDSISNGTCPSPAYIKQPLSNLFVSNSVTTTNIVSTLANVGTLNVRSIFGSGNNLTNVQTSGGPLANLAVSNTVTTMNLVSNLANIVSLNVGSNLIVTGAMTSNSSNMIFFYDTFVTSYIFANTCNTSVINTGSIFGSGNNLTNVQTSGGSFTQPLANLVVSNTVSSANLSVTSFANVATLNVSGLLFGSGNNLTNVQTSGGSFTQPLANLVVANTVSSANLSVTSFANVATLNVATIISSLANIGSIFGTGNNISNIQFSSTANLFVSNTITSNSVLAKSNLSVGPYGKVGTNVAVFSNGSNVVVINSNAWVGIGTANPTSSLTVNGNASFATDTLTVPYATTGTLGVLTGATIGPSTLGSNVMVLANSSGTSFTVFTGNSVGISNLAPATTLSVGGTISSLGNPTTYGTVAPVTWRQGPSSTNWAFSEVSTLQNYSLGSSMVQIQCGSCYVPSGNTKSITFPSIYTNTPIVMITSYTQATLWVEYFTNSSFIVHSTVSPFSFEWISIGI